MKPTLNDTSLGGVDAGLRGAALYEQIVSEHPDTDGPMLRVAFNEVANRKSLSPKDGLLIPGGAEASIEWILRFHRKQVGLATYTTRMVDMSPAAFAVELGRSQLIAAMGVRFDGDGFSLANVFDHEQAKTREASGPEARDALLSQLCWIGTATCRFDSTNPDYGTLAPQVTALVKAAGLDKVRDVVCRYWPRADAHAFLGVAEARELRELLAAVDLSVFEQFELINPGEKGEDAVERAIESLRDFLLVRSHGLDADFGEGLCLHKIEDRAPLEMKRAVISIFTGLVAGELAKRSAAGLEAAKDLVTRLASGICMLDGGPSAVLALAQRSQGEIRIQAMSSLMAHVLKEPA